MTTIAYRDGVMAADSRITQGDAWILPYRYRKIERLPAGDLVGFSGNLYLQAQFLDWLAYPNTYKRPDLSDTSKAIVVSPNGDVWIYQHLGEVQFTAPYFAIGCGAIPALAAMHMGADARRAVEVAAMLDNATGGDIDVIRLGE